MAINQEENLGPMKLIFNYNNVFYSFFYDDLSGCIHRSREYALNYVYSGEMILDNSTEKIHVRKGECVFIPRDHHITMYKKTYEGERYCGVFLMFTRNFLREMYGKLSLSKIKAKTAKLPDGVIKLPKTVELASLFASMTPYFDPEVKPKANFMELKLQEGLMTGVPMRLPSSSSSCPTVIYSRLRPYLSTAKASVGLPARLAASAKRR